jgi:hypothetical protein
MDQSQPSFVIYDTKPATPKEFVKYWQAQYDYQHVDVYEGDIVVTPVTEDRLRRLFTWKNGMKLSGKKAQALEDKIISKLPMIHQLCETFDEALFNRHFGKLRIVWRVFLLHIIKPERFPIFDQHVFRAYRCLHDLAEVGREVEPKLTMEAYEQYCLFYHALVRQCDGRSKSVDDALWAFDKFLSRYPWMVLSRMMETTSKKW